MDFTFRYSLFIESRLYSFIIKWQIIFSGIQMNLHDTINHNLQS
uniref:Uncharacterized protein n=1 Tax=Anguilla anguilla TaxID=7936 RepID=A0A0E9QKA7_ANGAN